MLSTKIKQILSIVLSLSMLLSVTAMAAEMQMDEVYIWCECL